MKEEDEETKLKWAAIERLATFRRVRISLFDVGDSENGKGGRKESEGNKKAVDVTKFGADERHHFIEKIIKHVEHDNLRLLQKMRERIDRVNVKLPTVEVRYKNLCVEAKCEVVQGKPLPTLWNSLLSSLSVSIALTSVFGEVMWCKPREAKIKNLTDVSGIIKPSS